MEDLIQLLEQPFKTIIYMRYIDNLTMDQIADKLDYSTARIYQLHNIGLNRLLDIANDEEKNLN